MSDQNTRPLADRIRPSDLSGYIGQRHLLAPGKPLYQAIQRGQISSMILWGPPGVGKTTLARMIAHETGRRFFELSAVSAGKDEVRKIVEQARLERSGPPRDLFSLAAPETAKPASPILFLDEIHRFNKAQQDFLLPYVEDGTVILIGATTENPSFEVISALLSRARVFTLEPLSADELKQVVERGASELGADLDEDASDFLVNYAGGDARQALNLLEGTVGLYGTVIRPDQLREALQNRHLRYDKADEHYNTISAFIKSMRASDVDAALYYLARMVSAGEDPRFIARRMVIFASEDVGIADAQALLMANAVFQAVDVIGYPECTLNLAHGAVYLARAPKNRACYDAIGRALEEVKASGALPIPLKLRNAPTQLMRSLGYGKDYSQYGMTDLLPEALRGRRFFIDENVESEVS